MRQSWAGDVGKRQHYQAFALRHQQSDAFSYGFSEEKQASKKNHRRLFTAPSTFGHYSDGKTPRHCAEAKDKPFTRADVDHAAGKVAEVGHSGLIFIYGPNARTSEDMAALVQEYEAKGFDLTLVPARTFAEGIVSLAPSVTPGEVIDLLNKHLALTRAKEVTIQHCKEVIERI